MELDEEVLGMMCELDKLNFQAGNEEETLTTACENQHTKMSGCSPMGTGNAPDTAHDQALAQVLACADLDAMATKYGADIEKYTRDGMSQAAALQMIVLSEQGLAVSDLPSSEAQGRKKIADMSDEELEHAKGEQFLQAIQEKYKGQIHELEELGLTIGAALQLILSNDQDAKGRRREQWEFLRALRRIGQPCPQEYDGVEKHNKEMSQKLKRTSDIARCDTLGMETQGDARADCH